jgi:hypothetical protein
MLPEALSDALGITLSEVLDRYYSVSDLAERGRLIEALIRRRTAAEGEEWLEAESRRMAAVAEMVHRGGNDTF